ncbi:hypothetical protein [Streptomyces carpaticus]|uniref:Secreted protein n=1 Tax=Streptomyces carpaticus TaxID=285558 RepID=A0ABV4ZUM0_9ACTN
MTANARRARTLCGGLAALFLFAVFLVGGVGPTLQPAESAASAPARTAPLHDDRTLLQARSADQDAAAHRRHRPAGGDGPAVPEEQEAAADVPSRHALRVVPRPAPTSPAPPPGPVAPHVMRC